MSNLPFDPLLVSIATPLALASAHCARPAETMVGALSYVAFAMPALMALHAWWHFAAAREGYGYAFLTTYSTGLEAYGISLKLGLNGICDAAVRDGGHRRIRGWTVRDPIAVRSG